MYSNCDTNATLIQFQRIYLLADILSRFIVLLVIVVVSFGVRDYSVRYNDGSPAETLGVDFQQPRPGFETSHVARNQLLSSH